LLSNPVTDDLTAAQLFASGFDTFAAGSWALAGGAARSLSRFAASISGSATQVGRAKHSGSVDAAPGYP
jgi:hypothetical protein